MIYPEGFENKLGFDKIRKLLADSCLSSLGHIFVEEMFFSADVAFIEEELLRVFEFKNICIYEKNFPLDNYFDLNNVLKKLRIEGTVIDLEELIQLKKSLATIKSIISFFKPEEIREKYPVLTKLHQSINIPPFIIDKIDSILTSNGKIKDNASPELRDIRSSQREMHGRVSAKLNQILRKALSEGIVDGDTVASIRNGRPVIPIQATYKRKIRGFIHDESASGKTVYIEPVEVVELNNEIKELENAEKREIYKILAAFTDVLRPYLPDLKEAYHFLGQIDFTRAKALFAIKVDGNLPTIKDSTIIDWFKARHPLLYIKFKAEKKEVVPLSIELIEEKRLLIISGPNAGGKSVCLKTVGLLQYMFQCGLLPPALDNSVFGIFANIFIDIGDEQSIDNDLSTYSSHLMNMKFFTKNANNKTLLLIDEFGTGTEPMLGGAIAEAVLNRLNINKTFGVITTHYTNLKHFAASQEGIINGAMLYDNHQMQPLFQLEIGKPGSSFAFEIARKIGLSEEILQEASEKIGKKHIDFDKHLKDVLRDKRYWENKRQNIRQLEKKLENTTTKYDSELEDIQKSRKEIIKKAKDEANLILAEANKKIENTIRQIKEANAEKNATKLIREEFQDFKKTKLNEFTDEDKAIQAKQEKLSKRKNKTKEEPSKKQETFDSTDIEAGDFVQLIGQDSIGEVISKNNKSYVVAFGQMITTLKENKIKKISKNQIKKLEKKSGVNLESWNIGKRKLTFKSELDIRGKRAEEALAIVSSFIDEAIMVNAKEVKILHGKGNGILRELIRDYLSSVQPISTFRDEHVEFGGAGITVVNFAY